MKPTTRLAYAFDGSLFERDERLGTYTAEASSLGLKPGEFPSAFLLEGLVFILDGSRWDADDDLECMNYTALPGETRGVVRASIFND